MTFEISLTYDGAFNIAVTRELGLYLATPTSGMRKEVEMLKWSRGLLQGASTLYL